MAGIVEERLATKQDLKELGPRLEAKIKELETNLRRDMKEMESGHRHDMKEMETGHRHEIVEMELRLKHDLTLRLGAMLVAGIVIVATLVKLL